MTAWANSASSLDYQTTSQGPLLCRAETNTLSETHQGTSGYFEAQNNNRGYFYLLETSQGGLSVNISQSL